MQNVSEANPHIALSRAAKCPSANINRTCQKVQHLLSKVILTNSADKRNLDSKPAQCSCNIGRCTTRVWYPCLDLLLGHTSFFCQAVCGAGSLCKQRQLGDLIRSQSSLTAPKRASPKQVTEASGADPFICSQRVTTHRRFMGMTTLDLEHFGEPTRSADWLNPDDRLLCNCSFDADAK